ncbi:MAG: flippase [bacterium]
MLKTILSNSFFSLVADAANRASQTLLVILVVRRLGESAVGLFTLGNNYVLLLLPIALWGLDEILIRDTANNRGQAARYFTHFFMIRLAIALGVWVFMTVALMALRPYSPEANRFVALFGGVIIGNALSRLGGSLFVALERIWVPASVSLCVGALQLAAGTVVLLSGQGVETLAVVLLLASWVQAATMTWLGRRHLHLGLERFKFRTSFCQKQLKAGFPFVPIALFMAFESQLGAIFLSFYHSQAVIGYYGMANALISAVALFSQAIRLGIFPAMARFYQDEFEQFVQLYERSWRYLSVTSLPIVILVVLLSDPLMHLIYGRTAQPATVTLQLLAPTLFFYFVNIPNARLIILHKSQRVMARFFGISASVSVLTSIFSVPRFGPQAVAVARVASMGILFALNCIYVHRNILPLRLWHLVWPSLGASVGMVFTVFVALADQSVWLQSLVGALVYASLLVCLGAIPTSDRRWMRQQVQGWAVSDGNKPFSK